ncbi:hypothetical protein AFA91_26710 [Mycolicibacterium goodii]|uniref:DUF5642 domain-containing protein n=2 Tax=Mycolicibacterium goodii TaxID=134601 RepID=A0A0K0XH18_MYCGD|nr:hypothetical protein AFA91_26710 [Mycolicibacterium goodii]
MTACATVVAGTPTWPGATMDRVLLTGSDFPSGVQYDRIVESPGEPDGTGGPPAMLSAPEGCTDGLTRVIADSAERGPGAAGKFIAAYDGARIVVTVLSSPLPLDRLDATAQRCAEFKAFFDPSEEGIPITTTRLPSPRPSALVYQQTMRLNDNDESVYFGFENVGGWSVFGIAFPTPNPSIPAKATLPETFLDVFFRQVERVDAR